MKSMSVLIICAALCACNQRSSDAGSTSEERLSKLEQRVKQIEIDHKQSEDSRDFTDKMLGWQIEGMTDSPASIDTDTKEFGIAHTLYGAFTVSAEQVEPYLDGYKVTLSFGNLSSATYSGAKVKIQWGPRGFGSEKEYQVPDNFLPGRWTRYQFAITPAKAADVKALNVSLQFSQVLLAQPLGQ